MGLPKTPVGTFYDSMERKVMTVLRRMMMIVLLVIKKPVKKKRIPNNIPKNLILIPVKKMIPILMAMKNWKNKAWIGMKWKREPIPKNEPNEIALTKIHPDPNGN